jgi:hypothetical protein
VAPDSELCTLLATLRNKNAQLRWSNAELLPTAIENVHLLQEMAANTVVSGIGV